MSTDMEEIRTATEPDFARILELNDSEVQKTSPMDRERLRLLVEMSACCKVATVRNRVVAFLIAMREHAPYDSENYRWFDARLATFLYVDRIVVAKECAGRGIGSRLYDDLFAFACSGGIDAVTCEYNLEPPNPASRAFHDKFGFRELGRQWVAGGTKLVSLQVANVVTEPPSNTTLQRGNS